jgi:L-alanine-DL-glutamate epimerase-like enolase superfamily enzyme
VEATPVTIGFREPEYWSGGQRSAVTSIVVELLTDDGLTGVGESVAAPVPEVSLAAIASAAELLVGRDPRQITRRWTDLQRLGGWRSYQHVGNAALAGIEMACWDLLGKTLNVPVHALLGGAVRDSVPVMGFVQNVSPDQIETDASTMAAAGYDTLYTKVGFGLRQDVAAAEALRRGGGPDVQVRVDPNEAWSFGEALRAAELLQPLDLQYIEQPIPRWSVAELAELRRRSPVPIAANQASWLNSDVMEILRARAADVIMTDPWQAGGIGNFAKAAALCEAAETPLVYHSFAPLSIAMRAAMQVLCSSPACTYANQTYSHLVIEDVVTSPVTVANGRIAVDHGPGLGVELDRDAVDRGHATYLRDGYASPYGPVRS